MGSRHAVEAFGRRLALALAITALPGLACAQASGPAPEPAERFGDRQQGYFGDAGQGYFGDPGTGNFTQYRFTPGRDGRTPPAPAQPVPRPVAGSGPAPSSPYIQITPPDAAQPLR